MGENKDDKYGFHWNFIMSNIIWLKQYQISGFFDFQYMISAKSSKILAKFWKKSAIAL